MGTTAQFLAEIFNSYQADPVTILFLEQGGRPCLKGILSIHLLDLKRDVLLNSLINQDFNLLKSLLVNSRKMCKVKAQSVRCYQ